MTRLVRPGRTTEEEILESAANIIAAVLNLPVLEQHKRDVISGMLWKITEARGKYTTRYRSRSSLLGGGAKLQHEHVFTRKDLTERILGSPEKVREILKLAVGCVVTIDEHRKLSALARTDPSLRGWDRYTRAEIEVVDMDADGK